MTRTLNNRYTGKNAGWSYSAQCSACGAGIRKDVKSGLCTPCRAKCPTCGGEKDIRANECDRCGKSRKARLQWADAQVRQRMQDALLEGAKPRLMTFDKLTEAQFNRRPDGRYIGYYREGREKRYIYRYQWVWILANGPIPEGHHIHHINGDCADDRLENLECMSQSDHARLHCPKGTQIGQQGRFTAGATSK